jgi:DNA invertase Pin-like site-specific DNA recombinase
LDAQRAALQLAGAERVFSEKVSGASTDGRRALARALAALAEGDVLVVTRLDRLARSTLDLLHILQAITKAGAGFRSLREAVMDTTTAHGRMVVTMLGAIAEFEREMIASRTSEGRARAMANGVRFGRKPKLTPHQIVQARLMLAEGRSQSEIGELLGVSHQTIGRLAP